MLAATGLIKTQPFGLPIAPSLSPESVYRVKVPKSTAEVSTAPSRSSNNASSAHRQKSKSGNIRVAAAVIDAARKGGEEVLRDLGTTAEGLTQAEAESRARTAGPNEIAQERRQGWFVRLLKIIRNPLVILLGALSAISFVSGDARAGTVMAIMVALSAGLRFLQEARADASAARLKAMIHVTATVLRDGKRKRDPAPRPCARRYCQALRRGHDSGGCTGVVLEGSLRKPGEPYR